MSDLGLMKKESLEDLLIGLNDDVNKGYEAMIEHIRDQQRQFNNYFTVIIDKIEELKKK